MSTTTILRPFPGTKSSFIQFRLEYKAAAKRASPVSGPFGLLGFLLPEADYLIIHPVGPFIPFAEPGEAPDLDPDATVAGLNMYKARYSRWETDVASHTHQADDQDKFLEFYLGPLMTAL